MRTFLALVAVVLLLAGCGADAPVTPVTAGLPASAALVVPAATADPGAGTPARTVEAPGTAIGAAAEPTVEQLIGQKLVVRMNGTSPSRSLLGRIRRGEIGGIVFFGFNITTKSALATLTGKLQAAAAAGGQPPLLLMVDQEGGNVKRLPWAAPTMSARRMGADGRTSTARSQGEATGSALRAVGVNVDLAPVADVPSSTSSFMYQMARTFSFNESKVSRLAGAFSAGVEAKRVASAMKHFPGIGRAKLNTDRNVVVVKASRTSLQKDIYPFRAAIDAGVDMIMLSNVAYTAYDPDNAAGWSRAISTDLLRTKLGFTGVTITDSLNGTAAQRHISSRRLAVRAARAGTDMVMLTGFESDTAVAFDTLVEKARSGSIPLDVLKASYARILALKAKF